MTIEELKNFRQLGSKTAGHPEYGHAPGIETTTGPLGQGITNAVGMAIAERMMNARFGDAICDHYTYVIAGDGCLMEGISHEAIDLAGHLKLNKLIVLWDDNSITIDGPTNLSTSTDQLQALRGCGLVRLPRRRPRPCEIESAIDAMRAEVRQAFADRLPHRYRLRRPEQAGQRENPWRALGKDEVAAARVRLNGPILPSKFPKPSFRIGARRVLAGRAARESWEARLESQPGDRTPARFRKCSKERFLPP